MLIDWFTVAAQAVNFLILAWLLKRFLYGPIITAMQERRERLADELDSAREAREKANRQTDELSKMREALERESESMLAEARKTADERREHWLDEAKTEVYERSKAWTEALEREQATIAEHLRIRIGKQIVRLSEKVLRDLAGDELEARVLDSFISQLDKSDSSKPSGEVAIHTGFPLSEPTWARLEASIHERFPDCGQITASQDESIGFGIVVIMGDNKWEWNLASYLDDVEIAIFSELAEIKTGTP
ncbi:F0F1 ATP synthase subunit B [uncultured Pseudodesulfovibrio sp.]|uniref:F0F1 ATP synthase subunit B n=1 Tax=uncultured Pseudodesulfovibrio sp. TaxID=2035858 RepID=UPI0029C6A5E7|nr:F0F1 ATP synthase subunit B [uncultured Pseudodesulfovibrio sp.]